jgi:hypothetical protein
VALDDSINMDAKSIVIDVLANDNTCNVDKSLLQVSFPNGAQTPYGSVKVLKDGNIRYTSGRNYAGHDYFTYAITTPADVPNAGDSAQISYATIYITSFNQDCPRKLIVRDDIYTLALDSLVLDSTMVDTIYHSNLVYLDLKANDVWCSREAGYIEIVEYPQGTIEQFYGPNGYGIYYRRPPYVVHGDTDKFRYRLTVAAGSKEADVTIFFE